jgi:hypothetical protein
LSEILEDILLPLPPKEFMASAAPLPCQNPSDGGRVEEAAMVVRPGLFYWLPPRSLLCKDVAEKAVVGCSSADVPVCSDL